MVGSGPGAVASSRAPLREQAVDVRGSPVHVRGTDGRAGRGVRTAFVHGNPTHSLDWEPFLGALEGPGLAFDLPAFGRTPRPPGFAATMEEYVERCGAVLDVLCPERFNLVVHDWGSVALAAAARRAERVERLVVICAVPLFADFRWHWIARIWRTPGLGEAFNRLTTRPAVELLLQMSTGDHRRPDADLVDTVWEQWGPDVRSAILSLYRSADPERLGAAGRRLGELRGPGLVVWGRADPFIDERFAHRYAAALGGPVEVELWPRAGHWPWRDRPELVDRVVSFLAAATE